MPRNNIHNAPPLADAGMQIHIYPLAEEPKLFFECIVRRPEGETYTMCFVATSHVEGILRARDGRDLVDAGLRRKELLLPDQGDFSLSYDG